MVPLRQKKEGTATDQTISRVPRAMFLSTISLANKFSIRRVGLSICRGDQRLGFQNPQWLPLTLTLKTILHSAFSFIVPDPSHPTLLSECGPRSQVQEMHISGMETLKDKSTQRLTQISMEFRPRTQEFRLLP